MEKDDQDGHQAALDSMEKDYQYGHQAALDRVEKDDQDGHQAAFDRMEWIKMTKIVSRRRLVGWSGER